MATIRRTLGMSLRASGQALDRVGATLQGRFSFTDQLCRHRRLMPLQGVKPNVPKDSWVAPNATVIGNVELGHRSAVWYGAVLRGDVNHIRIGQFSSLGDRCVVHVNGDGDGDGARPTVVGDYVTVGDGVILHACTLENDSVVESGSIVLDGATVSSESMLGPGSVLTPGKTVPSGELWAGNPAKKLRDLTADERANIRNFAEANLKLAFTHDEEHEKTAAERAAVRERDGEDYHPEEETARVLY